jgi:hypothetical protein
MEEATTTLGKIGELINFAARWISWFTRKYPMAGALYLGVYVLVFFIPNEFPHSAPSAPENSSAPSPFPPAQAPQQPQQSPSAQSIGQVQAFKEGNNVVIRWSSTVQEPQLFINGQVIPSTCQPQTCTAALPPNAQQVQAQWKELNQSFTKNFRL